MVMLEDFHSGSINYPKYFPADLLNPVVPTRLILAGGSWAHTVTAHFVENNARLGAGFWKTTPVPPRVLHLGPLQGVPDTR